MRHITKEILAKFEQTFPTSKRVEFCPETEVFYVSGVYLNPTEQDKDHAIRQTYRLEGFIAALDI
jgi:hypothetical protein